MSQLYYGSQYLYLVVSAVLSPVSCVILWLLAAQARRRRLASYTRWLLPMSVGSTVTLGSILILLSVAITRRPDYGLMALSYLLAPLAAVFHTIALVRLWKTVQALPPDRGHKMAPGGPEQEGAWPPAPRR